MREGALGVGSSLIYAPAFYAKTPELVELAKAAGEFGGMYISHMRSEGARLLEAIDELIQIAREAKVPAEIYHFKAAGRTNWDKTDAGDRPRRSGAPRGAAHHRRHLHLSGRRDRPQRDDAAVGAGRRLRRVGRAAEGSGDARARDARDDDPDRPVGELLRRRRPDGILLSASRARRSSR